MTHNFISTITLPTRITDNFITLVDHILLKITTKDINDAIVTGNIYSDITDHLPSFLLIYTKTSNTNSKASLRPLVRIFGRKNTEKFHNMLLNENWETLYKIHNPDEAIQMFYNKYNHTYEASFPLK